MVKRIVSKKKKKKNLDAASAKALTKKFYGDEPALVSIDEPDFDTKYGNLLSWYSGTKDYRDAKEFTMEYLLSVKRKDDAAMLNRVPDKWISMTMGWIARLKTRGMILKPSSEAFFERALESMKKYSEPEEPGEIMDSRQVGVADRVKDKCSVAAAEICGHQDEGFVNFNPDVFFTEHKADAVLASYLKKKFQPVIDELKLAISGKNPQVKEAYGCSSKKELQRELEGLEMVISASERIVSNAKRARAPRKKKPMTIEKKLRRVIYQKNSQEFSLVSENPEKILRSTEVWLLNTKYKIITVLRAPVGRTIDINGRTLTSYDAEQSFSYRTGRKSTSLVSSVMSGTKAAAKKAVIGLKTCATQDRFNENTMILRTIT